MGVLRPKTSCASFAMWVGSGDAPRALRPATVALGGQVGTDELGGLLGYLWCNSWHDPAYCVLRSFVFKQDG
jgi:hypothetical protein